MNIVPFLHHDHHQINKIVSSGLLFLNVLLQSPDSNDERQFTDDGREERGQSGHAGFSTECVGLDSWASGQMNP